MRHLTTIDKKGQITIPEVLRKRTGLDKVSEIVLEINEEGGFLRVKPALDIVDLAGSFKKKKKGSVTDAREEMENSYKRH